MANVKRRVTVIFYDVEDDKKYVAFATLLEASKFLELISPGYKYKGIKGFKRPLLKKPRYEGGLETASEGARYTVGTTVDDYV